MIDDIRYLIVFAKIVERGSISGGAAALGLTTATASTHLSRLEKNLNSALLYRNTRKISLTQDGISLLETARSMLELYERGVIEFKQRSISTVGKLRISLPAVFLNGPFTRHLANFIKENPDISLSISYSDLREDIIADSIDVAFRIGELPDSSLKARHLFVLPRQLVASKDLLMQHQPIKHPVEAAYVLAKQNIGLAVPPRFLCENDVKLGEMHEVLPDWSLEPLKVYAIWPANISTSSAAYKLINYIYNAMEQHKL